MAENEATTPTQLTFSGEDLGALLGIVTDWVNEKIAEEPYPEIFDSVIYDKVGIPREGDAPARRPLRLRTTQA